MADFIGDGYFPYAPREGIPGLRESIAAWLRRRKGVETDPSLTLPIDSASAAMQAVACTIPVSYTHLAVYKRQFYACTSFT